MPNEMMSNSVDIPEEDNRKERKDCSTCRWWVRARPLPEAVEAWGMEMFPFGECRGMPPSALAGEKIMQAQNDPTGNIKAIVKQARFPHTVPDDWCGMWEARA